MRYFIFLIKELLKTEEMYKIPNIHGIETNFITMDKGISFAKRVLAGNEQQQKNNPIHMTGNGIAGILIVIFLLIVPIIFIANMMDSIFVNTKLVERSLLVGKIDG